VHEEGLERRFLRHRVNALALRAGLEAMGLKLLVYENWLPSLTMVLVPDGVEDQQIRSRLLVEHGIEIGGGLGALKGQVWRIGLMGYSSRRENVMLLLHALEQVLTGAGFDLAPGEAARAADAIYKAHDVPETGIAISE